MPGLNDLLALATHADMLVEWSLDAARQSASTYPLSAQVHARLLIRAAQDLRAVVLLSTSGHTLQALSIASSLFEHVHALGYIGEDDARAQAWLEHVDEGRSYPGSVVKAIAATARALDDPEFEKSGRYLYQKLCMATHGNPVLQRDFGVQMESGVMRLQRGPFVSRFSTAMVRWCLEISIYYLLIAVLLFSRFRVRPDLAEEIASEMERIHEELAAEAARYKEERSRARRSLGSDDRDAERA